MTKPNDASSKDCHSGTENGAHLTIRAEATDEATNSVSPTQSLVFWVALHGRSVWDRRLQTCVGRLSRESQIPVRWGVEIEQFDGWQPAQVPESYRIAPPYSPSQPDSISVASISLDSAADLPRLHWLNAVQCHHPSAVRVACVSSSSRRLRKLAVEAGAQLILMDKSAMPTVVKRVLQVAPRFANPSARWLPIAPWPWDWIPSI